MSKAPFRIARNPEVDSKLPYLLQLPLDDGLVLKARDTWPRSSRIYCHPFAGRWPSDADVIEETPVALCRRRGAAIDLVLDRPRLGARSSSSRKCRAIRRSSGRHRRPPEPPTPGARVPRAARSRRGSRSRSTSIIRAEHAPGGWLADILARLQVRYPEVQVVFADSRRFAEEWTYRFLASALADAAEPHAPAERIDSDHPGEL